MARRTKPERKSTMVTGGSGWLEKVALAAVLGVPLAGISVLVYERIRRAYTSPTFEAAQNDSSLRGRFVEMVETSLRAQGLIKDVADINYVGKTPRVSERTTMMMTMPGNGGYGYGKGHPATIEVYDLAFRASRNLHDFLSILYIHEAAGHAAAFCRGDMPYKPADFQLKSSSSINNNFFDAVAELHAYGLELITAKKNPEVSLERIQEASKMYEKKYNILMGSGNYDDLKNPAGLFRARLFYTMIPNNFPEAFFSSTNIKKITTPDQLEQRVPFPDSIFQKIIGPPPVTLDNPKRSEVLAVPYRVDVPK